MAPRHLLVASLALVRHAYAGDAALYDSQFGSITNDEWDDIFSAANATDEVTFLGYDTHSRAPLWTAGGSRSKSRKASRRVSVAW